MSDSKHGYSKLIGFDRVVQHFGYWPTFHDAEVLSLTLDRDAQVGGTGPTLILLVHGFEITSEVAQAGFLQQLNIVWLPSRFMMSGWSGSRILITRMQSWV